MSLGGDKLHPISFFLSSGVYVCLYVVHTYLDTKVSSVKLLGLIKWYKSNLPVGVKKFKTWSGTRY